MMFVAVAAPQGDCWCTGPPVEMDEKKECILSVINKALWSEKFEDTKEGNQKS